jgi:cell division protein FtsQ
MSRSLAATTGRRHVATAGPRRTTHKPSRPASRLLRSLSGAATLTRTATTFVSRRRRLRIVLLAVVIAMPLLGGGWLWFRQSSFVSVQRVQITGVHGPEAQAVQAALADAAHGMSTLDASTSALRAAVASLRVVRAVSVIPSFPHGLRIEVSEQLPVAALTVAGVRTALAADGVVLGPRLLSGSLPSVSGATVPVPGKLVHGASLRAALAVLGAAPAPLAKHVERVFTGAKGLTVAMRNGLLVYFGDANHPHAKWLSLARVLADSGSAGASYVDVRLPTHPAAGFPAGVSPPDASAAASTGSGEALGSTESTITSLAAGLSGGSATSSEPASGSASATTEPSVQGAEASSTGSEASSTGSEASRGEADTTSETEGAQASPTSGG